MQLANALTATDMRMRENDVILGIPKSSYTHKPVKSTFLKGDILKFLIQ